MKEIKCPHDLNQFLLGEPIFENPFPEEKCKQRKFYGDCSHCFSTAIASRDHQLNDDVLDKIRAEIKDIAFDWQEIDGEHESFMVVDLNDAIQIIDKYKAESEE